MTVNYLNIIFKNFMLIFILFFKIKFNSIFI